MIIEFVMKRRVEWVQYPGSYLKLIKNNKHEFLPWHLIDEEYLIYTPKKLKKRYSSRNLFCFARKDYSDDIACWEKGFGKTVFIVHDFADPGWERRETFENFYKWYEWALTQEYN
jgi:hypothetical protein